MQYNEKMREIRRAANKTQEDVADHLKITRPQYQLYESGKRMIPINLLKEFCELFQVSADFILGLPEGLRRSF